MLTVLYVVMRLYNPNADGGDRDPFVYAIEASAEEAAKDEQLLREEIMEEVEDEYESWDDYQDNDYYPDHTTIHIFRPGLSMGEFLLRIAKQA